MKRVDILSIKITEDEVFSAGLGEDEIGDVVNFIGFTGTMKNIWLDMLDFEEHPEHGRPAIYLEAWQIQ